MELANSPLAIVGMACRLPGASGVAEYWDMISKGRSAITELPAERLNQSVYFDAEPGILGKTYSNLGGLIGDYRKPKAKHLLTESDLSRADPAHLELLSVLEDAIENAGWSEDCFRNQRAGVYIGHTRGTGRAGDLVYSTLIKQTSNWLREIPLFADLAKDQQQGIIESVCSEVRKTYPGRNPKSPQALEAYQASLILTKAYGIQGPSMALNAACASSLVALCHAAQALRLGQIEAAVVGSGSYCKFDSLILFSKAGSVSGTGSRPFDAAADGLISSEGYVIVMVKLLDRAVRDGDNILAVIRGLGYSSDGKGKSLWAPREEGQILAIDRAYSDYLSATRLQYVEAHATSTPVGDATELNALHRSLKQRVPEGTKIPVGSVKALVGHTLETAGLAGLVKSILALQHRQIPPVNYIQELNPKVDWDDLPLRIPTTLEPWNVSREGIPRRAGVNSFGIGGINAHVVLDEYIPTFHEQYFLPDPESERGRKSSLENTNQKNKTETTATPQELALEPIAIVGMSTICPLGKTLDEFWGSVTDGRVAISEPAPNRVQPEFFIKQDIQRSELRGGFLSDYVYDWRKHKVPPKQVASADPLQFMLLDAVDQAITDSGIPRDQLPIKKMGVIVGTVFGGEFGNQLQMGIRLPEFLNLVSNRLQNLGVPSDLVAKIANEYRNLLLTRMPALTDETGSFSSSTLASRITKTLDLMGGGTAIDCGHASGIASLNLCVNALRTHDADLMICAAGQRSCGQFAYDLLTQNDAFEENDSKNVPAEGVGVLVLKRLSDAKRDGNKIYSLIHEIHVDLIPNLDSSSDSQMGRIPATSRSIDNLRWIETPSASAEMKKVIARSAPSDAIVADLADQLGCLQGASGVVAMIRASKNLESGSAPASNTAGLLGSKDSERMRHRDSQAVSLVISSCDATVRHSVLLSTAERTQLRPKISNLTVENLSRKQDQQTGTVDSKAMQIHKNDSSPSIIRFAAETLSELLHNVEMAIKADSSHWNLLVNASPAHLALRLHIVANNMDDFQQKGRIALTALENGRLDSFHHAKGCYFRKLDSKAPRTALLFSGQGSTYPGMLLTWIKDDPSIHEEVDQCNGWLTKDHGVSLNDLFEDQDRFLGKDLRRTQLAIVASQYLLYRSIQKLGLNPDRILGHSFGEYASMLAAGCWNERTALQAAAARAEAVTRSGVENTEMLCAMCSAETAEQICKSIENVFVANRNSVQQTVIGGLRQGIQQAKLALQASGIRTLDLAVPFAFHTPLLLPACKKLETLLASIPISTAKMPFLSSVTGMYEADPIRIRQNLVEQLVAPVDWIGVLNRLEQEGVQFFVELGPSQILTGLGRRHFENRQDLIFVASDDQKRGAEAQKVHLKACIELFASVRSRDSITMEAKKNEGPSIKANPSVPSSHFKPAANGQLGSNRTPEKQYPSSKSNLFENIRIHGSAFEMGVQQGQQLRTSISSTLERMIAIPKNTHGYPSGLRKVVLRAERLMDEVSRSELEGVAAGSGINIESLITLNLVLYPDIDAGCSHYVAPKSARNQEWLHGANVDLPIGLLLRDALKRTVQLRTPKDGLRHALFGVAGQIGGLTGMNQAGLALSSAMLMDRPLNATNSNGLLHGLLISRLLAEADSTDRVVEMVRQLRPRGAWGLMISDTRNERATYLEFDGEHLAMEQVPEARSAANHSELISQTRDSAPKHSLHRANRLQALLNPNEQLIDFRKGWQILQDKFDLSRDKTTAHRTMNTVCRVDHQASILMNPLKRQAWISKDESSDGFDHEPKVCDLSEFFGDTPVEPTPASASARMLPSEYLKRWSCDETNPPDQISPDVCARLALRFVPKKLIAEHSLQSIFDGSRALLVGHADAGQQLVQKLQAYGCEAFLLDTSMDNATVISEARSLLASGPMDHLFLLPSSTVSGQFYDWSTNWESRTQPLVMLPYEIVQLWYSSLGDKARPRTSWLVSLTEMGGDHGWKNPSSNHHSGAMTGLLKAVYLERRVMIGEDLQAVAIDFEKNTFSSLQTTGLALDRALMETTRAGREIEVGYQLDQRHVCRHIYAPLAKPTLERNFEDPASEKGCWVVTGGARGVTAEIAKAIGSRLGGTLHLIGSSPIPQVPSDWLNLNDSQRMELRTSIVRKAVEQKANPSQAWESTEKAIEIAINLRTMRESGIQLEYHNCDISKVDQLRLILDKIRERGEPIIGVVHGAGYEKASRFSAKKLPLVRRTIDSKVGGAANLMNLTQKDPLRAFVAFGSISGRFGAVGQTDYALANDWLPKLVSNYRTFRPEVHSIVIDWHSWADVGMAARPETKHAKLLANMRFMPVDEGVNHFLNDLLCKSGEPECVITDWRYYRKFYNSPSVDVSDPVVSKPVEEKAPELSLTPESASSESSPERADLCDRFIVRMTQAPELGTPLEFLGPALIVGDNQDSRSVASKLNSLGVETLIVDLRDADTVADRLNQELSNRWFPHLFLMTSRDPDARLARGVASYERRRMQGIKLPFMALRTWLQRMPVDASSSSASVVAALDLGGDFGLHQRPTSPEGGAISGVVKSLRLECNKNGRSSFVVKAIDFDPTFPSAEIASRLVVESRSNEPLTEVGYLANQRLTPALLKSNISDDAVPRSIAQGGNWIVVGGGRGITALAALGLAKSAKLRMHLLGRAPIETLPADWLNLDSDGIASLKRQVTEEALEAGVLPSSRWKKISQQIELQKNLAEYRKADLEAHYYSIDASDRTSLNATLLEIRKTHGPIHGVIQGAGVRNSCQIEKKTDEHIEQMIRSKLDITHYLIELTRPDPIEAFISFGSITGRFGGNGGSDYALGADMICKMMGWLRTDRPEVRALGFHWHGWGGAGMMLEPAGFGARAMSKISLMPPEEGVRHIIRELNQDTKETEIVVTDNSYFQVLERENVPARFLVQENSLGHVATPLPLDPRPILDHESKTFAIELDPVNDLFLSQHRFRTKPLMPMVMMIEAFVEAATQAKILPTTSCVELRGLVIHEGLKFLNDNKRQVRVAFDRNQDVWKAKLLTDFIDTKGRLMRKDCVVAECSIATCESPIWKFSDQQLDTPSFDVVYPDSDVGIRHGKPFQWLRSFKIESDFWEGSLEVPIDSDLKGKRSGEWQTFPGPLDALLFGCGIQMWIQDPKVISIPISIDSIKIDRWAAVAGQGSTPEKLHSCGKRLNFTDKLAKWDAAIALPSGEVLMQIDGFEASIIRTE